MRKIAVVTGSRAEYGILKPVLKAIELSDNLKLVLIVTGMHLSDEFGGTLCDITEDVKSVVDMVPLEDTSVAMSRSVGYGIIGMVDAYARLQPDIVVVLGDRVEALAATIASTYMNIPVAHIHGGDRSRAGIDESARHAITKLAHIHFPATQESALRIASMGEDEWRIYMVGSPALDDIMNETLIAGEALEKCLGISVPSPLILVVQHSVTTQVNEAINQMRQTLDAIVEIGQPAFIIYPNADAGGRAMIEVIKEYESYPLIYSFKSLPRKEYLSLLQVASVLVGNSSSGIIDAPSFRLPVVNIGIRQDGRERGDNVIDAGHDKGQIVQAINKALMDEEFLQQVESCTNPYGDGMASVRIVEVLSNIDISSELLQKRISY